RYDPYESYDSRSSLNDRDLYRPGYDYPDYPDYPNDYPDYPNDYPDYPNDYPDYPNDYPGDYPGDYPDYPNESEPDANDFYGSRPREQQFQGKFRESFGQRGHGWGRERPFPGYPGRGGWNEPRGPPGSKRLPSLFSQNILPEPGAFQGFRGFPGNFRGMKRMRRGWKMWDADFRVSSGGFFFFLTVSWRKQPSGSEEPEGKAPKTDGSDNSDSDNDNGQGAGTGSGTGSGTGTEPGIGNGIGDGAWDRERDRERSLGSGTGSGSGMGPGIGNGIGNGAWERGRDREQSSGTGSGLGRIPWDGDPVIPENSLQEYVANKTRKTEERRRGIKDINAVIQQIYREQDLTQEVGMEHFLRKVEAAHCSACDLLIPMQFGSIQKHLKSLDHNHNRRAMMEQSKKSSLVVARSILNNKLISKKLEKYLKGENPFTDDPEEKEEHEEGEGGGEENPGNAEEGAGEENPENPEGNPEGNLENPEENLENPEGNVENPQNPEENPEENKDPEEIPGTENEETGTGTNPEPDKAENSQNPQEFPEEFPREEQQEEEETSGMHQE
ncbi:AKP8L protein, partial [Aphelocoma coerulescens]|nr:AKP8L protein [Aphelocoma coerulescens]